MTSHNYQCPEIPPRSGPRGFAPDTAASHLHPAPSHPPTSCLSCCSHHTRSPVTMVFHPVQPAAGQKGQKPSREIFGRSGLTGEGESCEQKGFGSLLEDTGQLMLNHHPKGAQFQPGVLRNASALCQEQHLPPRDVFH